VANGYCKNLNNWLIKFENDKTTEADMLQTVDTVQIIGLMEDNKRVTSNLNTQIQILILAKHIADVYYLLW